MLQSTRQLAAIMFTDIVGYTALMGQDERKAIDLVRVNLEIQKPLVESHSGKWLKEIGDGTLCQFSSAFDAVSCAQEIQHSAAINLDGKLRIGIHLGDITIEGGEIYGDGVNIASRLESCADPGGIFVSESVHRTIRSNSAFELGYIGEIPLKNVREPVQTYYVKGPFLPVPTKARIKNLTGKDHTGVYKLAIIAAIFIGIISLAGWWYQHINPSTSPNPVALEDARIAILPFENKTNDPDLDMLGEMAADWIISGLMNLDNMKLVSSQTVKNHISYAEVSMENQEGPTFFDRTGADKIIQGNYYEQGNQIVFHGQLIDVISGNIEHVLPEVVGEKSNLNEIVVELQKRIMTMFIKDDWDANSRAPNYDAYKKFQEGLAFYGKDHSQLRKLLTESINIDSTYISPYAFILSTYESSGSSEQYDSVLTIVKQRFAHAGAWEATFINFLDANLNGTLETQYAATKKLYIRDPKNYIWNFRMGLYTYKMNKPHEAIQYYEQIDPRTLNYKYGWEALWNLDYAYNLIRVGNYERALEVLSYVPQEFVGGEQIKLIILIRILKGEEENLLDFVNQLEKEGKYSWGEITSIYISASRAFLLIKDQESHNQWNQLLRDRVVNSPKKISLRLQSNLAFLFGDYSEAIRLTRKWIDLAGENWWRLARIGSSYAYSDRTDKAREVIMKLDSLGTGGHKYGIAQIYAALDEKQNAVDFLEQALAKEMGPWPSGYDFDSELATLHGYRPFDAIASPEN